MNELATHELLERMQILAATEERAVATRNDLKPVQLKALQYLRRANRYSDTAGALADYLGLTKGTVSQTVQALERRGFLARRVDANDGRVVHLRLAAPGKRIADEASTEPLLIRSLKELGGNRARKLERDLRALVVLAQRLAGRPSFGVCRTCRLFENPEAGRFRCGLTQESLSDSDSQLICREHRRVTSIAAARSRT